MLMPDVLCRYYIFSTEFFWNVLDPREDGQASGWEPSLLDL
jgi:hypothetical protein